MFRRIGFLAYDGFQVLDLTGPMSVFEAAIALGTTPAYSLDVVSHLGGSVRSSAGLEVSTRLVEGQQYDTVVVPGGAGARAFAGDDDHRSSVLRLAEGARRVACVCTGAFILAGAGLLDRRRATTHWRQAADLQREHPAVLVDADPIFVRDGYVWSSAGVTAGIDLALALVEEDLGPEAAKAIARELVVYYRRPGTQSQFSTLLDLQPSSDRIQRALTYAREHLGEVLSIAKLAEVACISERQFSRSFQIETGESPAKAVERLRVEAAVVLLERAGGSIDAVGAAVGFTSSERMRRAFIRVYGYPPQAIRRRARDRCRHEATA